MKIVVGISIPLNVVLLCWILQGRAAVDAAGRSVPIGNGDVNADGKIDLDDPLFLLAYLFQGGEAPRAIESQQAAVLPSIGLPVTGQTKCYDGNGGEISCDDAEFPGQDGFFQSGCANQDRFVDNGDGTETDRCTGLMWQKDSADLNGNGRVEADDYLDWQGALKYCDALSFAGHSDWRLPNVRELQSIADYSGSLPTIDPAFGAMPFWYWSSSTNAQKPGGAWGVSLGGGYVVGGENGDKLTGGHVRAVRTIR